LLLAPLGAAARACVFLCEADEVVQNGEVTGVGHGKGKGRALLLLRCRFVRGGCARIRGGIRGALARGAARRGRGASQRATQAWRGCGGGC